MIKEFLSFDLLGYRAFEKAIVQPPFRMIAKMPDEACFYFVTQGGAKVNTPTAELELKTNEGLVMQCGTYLNGFLKENDVEYCEAIAVHLYPELLKAVYDSELPNFLEHIESIEPLPYEKVQASQLMTNYVNSLKFYFENPEIVSEELLKLKIKELMILLAKTDNLQAIKQLFGRLFTKYEYEFTDIIDSNVFNEIGLEELAALTNRSLSSFKRKFNAIYDTSPGKYIRSKRIERASKLLSSTELSVTEICFECGFSDLAHFSKVFSKIKGTSPSKYRMDLID